MHQGVRIVKFRRIILAVLFFALYATASLSAGTAAILSSSRKNDTRVLDAARRSTVDLYTTFETEKGNEVITLDDYHVPAGVETLYIIAHGWERKDGSGKGFVYVGNDGEEHWMTWESYLPFLDAYSDVKTLVVNACMSGAAVRTAREKQVEFNVFASCGENESEPSFFTHPLEYAVAYVNGEIPETIKNFTCDTHPVSYIADSSVGAVL